MNNILQEIEFLKRRYCQLEKKVDKLLLLQVNGIDNDLQSILDLVNSDTVTFEDLGDGKVTAYSSGGSGGGANIEIADNYASIDPSIDKRFIYVITDEMNYNDSSLYIYTGSALKFLLTVPVVP